MKKILNSDQFRELDAYTISSEPIAPIDLMERASTKCVEQLEKDFPKMRQILIVAGSGNNGGDGLAIARLLTQKGHACEVCLLGNEEKLSPDNSRNLDRCRSHGVSVLINPNIEEFLEKIQSSQVLIDSLFGNGLDRPIIGQLEEIVNAVNQHPDIVSIDLPSGMACNPYTFNHYQENLAIIKARFTYTFQVPKLNLLLDDLQQFCGTLRILDIGLNSEFHSSFPTQDYVVEMKDCKAGIIPRSSIGHKGSFGHALIIAGQYQMMGAALLASNACLRSGVGLLTLHCPADSVQLVQSSIPECLVDISKDKLESRPNTIDPSVINRATAIGIGCGLGTSAETSNSLKGFLANNHWLEKPIVLDADALNMLSQLKEGLEYIKDSNVLLTPHPKEFDRLFGANDHCADRLSILTEQCQKLGIHILLKGATTVLGTPSGERLFFNFPNSGMAKGGSGDVLTGIITSLLAQGYSVKNAAMVGIGAHASAGFMAKEEYSEHVMLPRDVLDGLKSFFM